MRGHSAIHSVVCSDPSHATWDQWVSRVSGPAGVRCDAADPSVLLAGVPQVPPERVKAVADRRSEAAAVQHPGDHDARLTQTIGQQVKLVGQHQQRALVPAAQVA